jgi:pimeloyl-ACP methyl ester carboxylesterase
MTLEALRQGTEGAAWDTHLLYGPWGFPLGEVGLPILLWHGEADTVVPVAMGRWLARTLPHCRAEFLPGLGHFALPLLHAGRILAAVKAHGEAAKPR